MQADELAAKWDKLAAQVLSGMAEWRSQHPRATLREIEAAADERLNRLRAQMVEDSAATSPAADWVELPKTERPTCPHCNVPLRSRGKRRRQLQTHGGQLLQLERNYGTCPKCGGGLFPPR